MNTKFALRRCFWSVLIFLLVACGAPSTEITPTSMTTITSTPAPSFTPVSPTATIPPVTSTETSILPVSSAPDQLRMAYVIDGNLYFQDGSKPPLQLTQSGKDSTPVFSDDGEKIVFFRGLFPHDIYTINIDGSQEQALVTNDLLIALNLGYSDKTEPRLFSFVPSTHQLLFNTHELDSRALEAEDPHAMQYRIDSDPNHDLLLVDTDTTEIRSLLPQEKGGPFQISPDGKIVGIQAADRIDVIGLDGKVIHHNLVTYPVAYPKIWMPDIYWSQDSSKLNVVLPIPTAGILDYTGPEPQTVWQYSMDGSPASKVPLSPPPMDNWLSFSPDGKLVIYTFADYAGKTNETKPLGIYIGNLQDGSAQLLEVEELSVLPHYFYWSPDSIHFVFKDELRSRLFMGNINGDATPINGSKFLGWVDDSRYLYDNLLMGEIGKEEVIKVGNGLFVDDNSQPFTFIFLAL